jgi:hypothetical protein
MFRLSTRRQPGLCEHFLYAHVHGIFSSVLEEATPTNVLQCSQRKAPRQQLTRLCRFIIVAMLQRRHLVQG